MPPEDRVRLGHLVEAAETAIEFASARTQQGLAGVKSDGYFQTRAREIVERDARIVEQLAPTTARKGSKRNRD